MNLQDTFSWKCWLLIVIGLSLSHQAWSTHLVGGEMYYEYMGDNQYEISLVIYRDCGPTNTNGTGFDNAANIAVYEGFQLFSQSQIPLNGNAVSTIDLQSGNPCAELPAGVCVERAVYTTLLTLLPSSETYTIVYQRCCRNPQVINLQDPTNTGFTIFVEVPPVLGNDNIDLTVNSTARFDDLPQGYVCIDQPFSLPNPATDPDGDSLRYSIGDVFLGGSFAAPTPNPPLPPPYNNVVWDNGYTPLTPLGNDEADWITVDPATGTLSGSPTTVGKYVIGLYVTEYRQDEDGNWTDISRMFRDFTIDVVPCALVFPAVQWPEPCSGLDLSFAVNADEGAFSWDFGTGSPEDTSSSSAPNFVFEEAGPYTVSLAYDLGGCGDSLEQDILVAPPISADFSIGGFSCLANGWSQDVSYSGDTPGATGSLVWTVDGEEAGNGTNPSGLFVPPGPHTLAANLVSTIGCELTTELDVDLPGLPVAAFTVSDPPCNGLEISFTNQSSDASSYEWQFDLNDASTAGAPESGLENPTWSYSGFGQFEALLIAQPGAACADSVLVPLSVLPQDPLVMSFGAVEPLACSLETDVDFTFDGAFADDVSWSFGSAGSASGDTVNFDFGTSGLFPVTLTITNDTCGTVQTANFEVYVPELVSEVEMVIPNIFTPNADGKNDRFRVGTRLVGNGQAQEINTSSFTQFKLQVYDRWGVLVHVSEGAGAGWDGRIGGRLAAPGVYYYIVNADHSCLDADITEVGEVTLLLD